MRVENALRNWPRQSPIVSIENAQPSSRRATWKLPTVGNVFVRLPSGNLLLMGSRQVIENKIGDAGKPVYLWNGRRVMHLNGAQHEFVLYDSSKYNAR
jgi:hypothetical protein